MCFHAASSTSYCIQMVDCVVKQQCDQSAHFLGIMGTFSCRTDLVLNVLTGSVFTFILVFHLRYIYKY
jgi:hypothetical protein